MLEEIGNLFFINFISSNIYKTAEHLKNAVNHYKKWYELVQTTNQNTEQTNLKLK